MNHLGTQTIETERLILRKLEVSDAESMYKNWASDPEVTKFLTWPPHKNVEASRVLLGIWAKEYEEDNYYQWGIELKSTGDLVGSISVVTQREEIDMVNIGYCIGRPWWHRGIMTEALSALIKFFFEEVGANRIEARHDLNNPHSGEVMKKCGMTLEGVRRSADFNNQGVCDVADYAILRSDYFGK